MDSDNSGAWIGLALVGVIVIGGFIYFFTGQEESTTDQRQRESRNVQEQPKQSSDKTEDEPEPKQSSFEFPGEVKRYVRLAEEDFALPEGKEKYKHEYTRERLESLGDAFVALSQRMNGESNRARQIQRKLEGYGAAIQEDWTDRHSDDVRKAFLEAYDAFDYLKQLSRRSQLDLTELRSRAESLDPNTLYLEQKSRAEAFFKTTARTFQELKDGK